VGPDYCDCLDGLVQEGGSGEGRGTEKENLLRLPGD
jgi:hypothetical protein